MIMKRLELDFWYWAVKLLPTKLIYFCFMHVVVHSTTRKYSSTVVPELTWMDAIARYGNDKGVER